jgi:predicted aldo/keto reductase-like oxidoreductase
MAVKMIKTGIFSTVQFPFNLIETDAKDDLHRLARETGLGIIAMKPFGGGVIDNASVAFKYLRQFPDVIPIPGFDSKDSVDQVVSIYEHPNELYDEDIAAMDRYRAELGRQFCRRCEYCQPCPNGVMITSAMGYKIVASRMSPAVSTQFLKQVMETVPECVDCGDCVKRCPYELPIPEMLKKYYDLYQEHRTQLGLHR